MANTLDIGPLFFDLVTLEPAPLVHFGQSQEVQSPFRSSRVAVFRLYPFHKGLVVGWWKNRGLTEEQALTNALQAWGIDLYDDDGMQDPEVRACIRENLAKATTCLEDEWLIVDVLGLDK